jgi:hypothetical protein
VTIGSSMSLHGRPIATLKPLEIAGSALPSNFMSVQTTIEKLVTARAVIKGVRKRWSSQATVFIDGEAVTPDAIIARYEAQMAAIDLVAHKKAEYEAALAAERAMRKPMQAYTLAVKGSVRGFLGVGALPDFGWAKPKKPGPKTLASKLAGVQKRAARRRKT